MAPSLSPCTVLVLDEQLLKEATRLAGGKTYSETVNLAL
jgi:Arc/MetJ family transcription regulator